MRLLRLIRAVLWSLVGVRRGADAARDVEGASPQAIVAVALVVVATLVVAILLVVHFVVSGREGSSRGARTSEPSRPSTTPIAPNAQGPVVVADTIAERVRPCTTCHGSTTEATRDGFSPRIAGKPAGYLFNQLASFRDGRRTYPPMVYLVQYMTDDYLREMADHFASVELPYAPSEPLTLPPETVARVRGIVEHGDPARDVPACVECHGASLAGVAPAIPGLLGLPRHYVTAQLGAWRNGRMRALTPDCMGEVARRLAPADVNAIAAWLAAQPVLVGMKPESGPRKLPMACGSVDVRDEGAGVPRSADSASDVAKGRYLVIAGDCIACHTAIGGAAYAGGRPIETPFGTVYSSNITPDAATGIGDWSRDDFWRALHNGRSKDGRLLYPAFPYPNFTNVTRADADAMYAYLRTLAPVQRANTPHALRFPYGTQAALAIWRALFFRPGVFIRDPDNDAMWNRGAYLVRGLGHCDACHATRNVLGAVSGSLDLGGGLIPMQNWYAPPLVSASGQGAASWDASEIAALLTSGVAHRAMAMGPMAEVVFRSTQHLSPDDAAAIARYLRSFGPTAKPPARQPVAANADVLARGAAIYGDACAQCHGGNGEGAYPAYPALAGNPSVTAALAANAIKAVLEGGYAPVTAANPRPYGMPPFFGRLNDADVAAVLTYVRAAWGNAAEPVSTFDVERFR